MKTSLVVLAMVLCVCVLGGCKPPPTDGPPQVRYGQDSCIHCGMIISDERFAAATVATVDGASRHLLFDDIGDMLAYERKHPEIQVQRRYVHDHATREWLNAAAAIYLKADGLHTPMGSGIAAFATREAAEKLSTDNPGEIADLDRLIGMSSTTPVSDSACCGE